MRSSRGLSALTATVLLTGCATVRQELAADIGWTSFDSDEAKREWPEGGVVQYRALWPLNDDWEAGFSLSVSSTAVFGIQGDDPEALSFWATDLGPEVRVHIPSPTSWFLYAAARWGILRGAEWAVESVADTLGGVEFRQDDVVINHSGHRRGAALEAGIFLPVVPPSTKRTGVNFGVIWLPGAFENAEYSLDHPQTGVPKIFKREASVEYSAWLVHVGLRGPFSVLRPYCVLGLWDPRSDCGL